MGTKESKVTGRNSRDWEKKKKKETKLKYFQLAQIVKTPLCGTTWWVMIIVKQGKIIIYNHSCVIWIDNNANLHPSSYQKLWHNPQNVLAAYGANPMSFFSIYASRHLFSFGTLPMGWKPLKFPVWWSHKGSCFCSYFFSFFSFSWFCVHHFSIFSQMLITVRQGLWYVIINLMLFITFVVHTKSQVWDGYGLGR